MKTLLCFVKKEFTEYSRTGKLIVIFAIAILFGLMNPAIAKLTPFLLETASEMGGMKIVMTDTGIDASMSWQQFYKNIPMLVVAFLLIFGGTFTQEYQKNTLIPIITKGLSRWKVVVAKYVVLLSVWTLAYFSVFGLTYYYNDYYWDNGIMSNLGAAAVGYWLYGVLMVSLMVLFSTMAKNFGQVLLGVGGVYIVMNLLALADKLVKYLPTYLCSYSIVEGAKVSYITFLVCSICIVACVASSVMIFNKKYL